MFRCLTPLPLSGPCELFSGADCCYGYIGCVAFQLGAIGSWGEPLGLEYPFHYSGVSPCSELKEVGYECGVCDGFSRCLEPL